MSEQFLNWGEEWDDNDNSEWVASAPCSEEDSFEFRIKQRLQANRHEWYEASSPEMMKDEDEPRVWTNADDAKQELEKDCADMVEQFGVAFQE